MEWLTSRQSCNGYLARTVRPSFHVSMTAVEAAVQSLLSRHHALRLKFDMNVSDAASENHGWSQRIETCPSPYKSVIVRDLTTITDSDNEIQTLAEQLTAEIDLESGINGIIGIVSASQPGSQALLIAMGPCVVDQDSMNILTEELLALLRGDWLIPPSKASLEQWSESLHTRSKEVSWEKDWDSLVGVPHRATLQQPSVMSAEHDTPIVHGWMPTTADFGESVLGKLGADPLDILLAAVADAVQEDTPSSRHPTTSAPVIWVRERITEGSSLWKEDTSRLVGPLAIEYPVSYDDAGHTSNSARTDGPDWMGDAVQRAKDARRRSRAAAIDLSILNASMGPDLVKKTAHRIVLVLNCSQHTDALVGVGEESAAIIQLCTGQGYSRLSWWYRSGVVLRNGDQVATFFEHIAQKVEEMSLACSTLPKQVLTAS
ncbi:hypothetical protein A4X09_0g7798, partial [Tilletia walkeri]